MKGLLENSVLNDAMTDIETLGVSVSAQPLPGAKAYAVVGGRANARWWLIPLTNREVAFSGFALFQPLLTSARIMKLAVGVLSQLGLNRLWVRQRLYIAGESDLGRYFTDLLQPSYAYFTGTNSPHRKVAVQVMDQDGRIHGFAKLGRGQEVSALMAHEAVILQQVQMLNLKTAYVPKLLFAGQHNGAYCFVTDTLKTPQTRSVTNFGKAHLAFLQELAEHTAQPTRTASDVASAFFTRVDRLQGQLQPDWLARLQAAVTALHTYGDLPLPQCLSHGDFTPWNTFLAKGRLYVFDWEYAEESASPGNDIVHFVLNQPQHRSDTPAQKVATSLAALKEHLVGLKPAATPALLLVYLLTNALRQVERLPAELRQANQWDDVEAQAGMLDKMLAATIEASR